jgi:hypothetical protein
MNPFPQKKNAKMPRLKGLARLTPQPKQNDHGFHGWNRVAALVPGSRLKIPSWRQTQSRVEAPSGLDKIGCMRKQPVIHDGASNAFIHKHASCIRGVLSGFDRLRLRGTLRQLYGPQAMEAYLNACHILIKDFGQLVERTTKAVKDKAKALAEKAGRPFLFVPSSQTSKEDLARKIAARDKITDGLIAILNCIEPCMSFQVVRNPPTKHIEVKVQARKCGHLYFYSFNTIGALRRANTPPMSCSRTRTVWPVCIPEMLRQARLGAAGGNDLGASGRI